MTPDRVLPIDKRKPTSLPRPDLTEPAGRPEEWFQRLSQLSTDMVSIFDAERLLQKIMRVFADVAGVEKGSLMLVDESGEFLEIRASIGVSDRARAMVKPRIGEGIAGYVARTGKSVLVEDVAGDKDLYLDFFNDPKLPRPKESMLVLPIIYRGEVLGVINLDKKKTGEPFRSQDEAFLSVLTHFAAVALANVRFYSASITDGLTGLVNQQVFRIRLKEEMNRARRYKAPLVLVMMDLDFFKKFNDTHGHPMGDRALRHLAKILRDNTRSVDIVGRCGGEEFGVILLETVLKDGHLVTERLRSRIEKTPLVVDGKNYSLTASFGAAELKTDEASLESNVLIERADQALYRAKSKGRNCVSLWSVS
ncbi:MAG TPA: sensor domain-containing diguanylate cyclase [Elusimicrobiota bacterium]|nr:sensor domain-containing diguanylate cyclase [Elusimicrobiota bacterium]